MFPSQYKLKGSSKTDRKEEFKSKAIVFDQLETDIPVILIFRLM